MYTVDFVLDGSTIESLSPPEGSEEVWIGAGFDLRTEEGVPALNMMADVLYASQLLKASPEYFRGLYGGRYLTTLRFLDDLYELCESYPDATLDVRY
ncbi:MAG: hypothetical protein M0R06_04580 [Sphaerochaeta sp.]|jgi:hypothetical protein|nr:hypothetical protein [Sphaerochaeta sp.]